MNADRKLISQPSVDSENNERVSTDRVGSFPFHAYNQYPTIYVCTHNGPTLHAHCVTIVLIPSLHRYLFFHSYLFISFFISITFLFLFIPLFIFFNFWHRLFQANMESCRFFLYALCIGCSVKDANTARMERNFFYFYSFWWKIILRCEVQF